MGTGLMNKLLKTNDAIHRLVMTLVALCILIAIGWGVWLYFKMHDGVGMSFFTNDRIDDTPTIVEQMREIGQWEFLSISDEELIDTVRTGFFSDDELVRIYYGTLRIGIDFSQCDEKWIEKEGDSIKIDLPPVQLLDENFLDEARTRSFFESGKWSNADRKAMSDRAKAAMRKRQLTKANMALAQKNAEMQVKAFVCSVLASRP
jgi:hypothetical protein